MPYGDWEGWWFDNFVLYVYMCVCVCVCVCIYIYIYIYVYILPRWEMKTLSFDTESFMPYGNFQSIVQRISERPKFGDLMSWLKIIVRHETLSIKTLSIKVVISNQRHTELLKSHSSKMSVIYMQSWKQCTLPVITTSCAQVHGLAKSHCGGNREVTLFSWLNT